MSKICYVADADDSYRRFLLLFVWVNQTVIGQYSSFIRHNHRFDSSNRNFRRYKLFQTKRKRWFHTHINCVTHRLRVRNGHFHNIPISFRCIGYLCTIRLSNTNTNNNNWIIRMWSRVKMSIPYSMCVIHTVADHNHSLSRCVFVLMCLWLLLREREWSEPFRSIEFSCWMPMKWRFIEIKWTLNEKLHSRIRLQPYACGEHGRAFNDVDFGISRFYSCIAAHSIRSA